MSIKVISFGAWSHTPATNAYFRVIKIDQCPNCLKKNVSATHHAGAATANCHACYSPFECPPPPRRDTSGLH